MNIADVQTDAPKVPFTPENIKKCNCRFCPVPEKSRCVKEKLQQMKLQPPATAMLPKPEDVPLVYCSTGVATCKDLDHRRMCVCAGCPVWRANKLARGKPEGYFCRDGRAQ